MRLDEQPQVVTVAVVLTISVISAFISIANRIGRGHKATLLWVLSEFSAAILCGYLAYDLFPKIKGDIPAWITMPILVAFTAHVGGRTFQEVESYLARKYPRLFSPPED